MVRWAGLVVATVFLSMGATGCSWQSKPQPSASPQPHAAAISKAKGEYTKALAKAKAWQDNASLERIYRQYEGTLTPTDPVVTVYAFASLADPTKTLEYKVSSAAEEESKTAKQPFELMMGPIDTAEWNVDTDRALNIAEENGGRQFRESHLAGYRVLVQLSKVRQYPLQWYIRYDTGDASNLRYEVWVNGKTGTIDNQKESPVGV